MICKPYDFRRRLSPGPNGAKRRLSAALEGAYTHPMRFRCIVSYRTARSKSISTWHTTVHGKDISLATAKLVQMLKRRQRRPVTVLGMYLQVRETSGGS